MFFAEIKEHYLKEYIMKPTKKDLKKLLDRIESQKDEWERDSHVIGYNQGLNRASQIVQELIDKLEE